MESNDTSVLRPVLKWAGGKRKVLPFIRPLVPKEFGRYVEPFTGGGAVFFDLAPSVAVINDANPELIQLYKEIKNSVDELIELLNQFEVTSENFYEIRSWDRDLNTLKSKTAVELAARTIFLNRCGYNGLYRVNSSNQFNVPYGKHANPLVCDEVLLRSVSKYLNSIDLEIRCQDFRAVLKDVKAGDFLYVDPPYAPLDEALSTFTNYTANGFDMDDLVELKDCLDAATEIGATWVMSNVKASSTKKLFPASKYRVTEVQVARPINSKPTGRGTVTEILVRPR
jgi:DNA adenine methylase